MNTVKHLDGSFAMGLRAEIPQSSRCLAAGVLVLCVHTLMRKRVNMQPGI